MRLAFVCAIIGAAISATAQEPLPHSVWLEAETFGPLHGSNFSFQQPDKTTKGSWSLAGPDVATAWTQGGESEFLSVAARADEPGEVVIGRETVIPADGTYTLWVRYVDHRLKKQSFGVRIKQGAGTFSHVFGEKPVVDDLDPMKLLWDCAFGWDHAAVELKKGDARLELYTTGPTEARRQVDCLCLTTDAGYHPCGREKPDCAAWQVLRAMRDAKMSGDVEPLSASRKNGAENAWNLPAAWKASDRPVFLWNTGQPWFDELKKPGDHIEWPFNIDESLKKEFISTLLGKEMPVFGDTISGPTIHIPLYPQALATGSPLLQWLDRHPDRPVAVLLNYGDPRWEKKTTDADRTANYANIKKLGSRFIGYVAGESISYDAVDDKAMTEKIRAAKTRADVLQALRDAHTAATVKKFSDYYGTTLTAEQAWEKVIPCLSAGNEAFTHPLADWGVKRVGHENSGNSPTLARRLAFLRGAARQFGGGIVDYQSCNLGDASMIFSRDNQIYPASSRYIFDNQYDAWAGAGLNWVLKDYLLFHIAGADAFYHEEGQDIFWKPGGGAAGDSFPIGLSPRGRVTQAVMQLAKAHPRGSQYTPIAFLLDEAHGYSQETFQPGLFGLDPTLNPVLAAGKHQASIRGWFDVAYFPAPLTQNEPSSGVRQTFVNGIFGDIFDIVVNSPNHADIIKSYPVLIAAGDVPLSAEWGQALKRYCEDGGMLVVCDGQFSGPGAEALSLPAMGQAGESCSINWKATNQTIPCDTFTYHAVNWKDGHALATVGDHAIAVSQDRGRGRLIMVGIPMGLGIDERPSPVLALLLRHLTQNIMPIHVTGDVEWAVNRLDDGSWLVTLLNNRGVIKPQHGVVPTDYHEAQTATLHTPFGVAQSTEWITGEKVEWTKNAAGADAQITIPAGVVRMLHVQPK